MKIHSESAIYWVELPWWLPVSVALGIGAVAVILVIVLRRRRVERR